MSSNENLLKFSALFAASYLFSFEYLIAVLLTSGSFYFVALITDIFEVSSSI